MFNDWAQPVVDKKWAVATIILEKIRKITGKRFLGPSIHRAWERACGIESL